MRTYALVDGYSPTLLSAHCVCVCVKRTRSSTGTYPPSSAPNAQQLSEM